MSCYFVYKYITSIISEKLVEDISEIKAIKSANDNSEWRQTNAYFYCVVD